MKARLANHIDMESIFLMGADVWGCDMAEQQYLQECRNSKKYKQGTWYCLENDRALVSSMIIYDNRFGLNKSFAGFGSIATTANMRNKGYASTLIKACIDKLATQKYSGIYLFNETSSNIYNDCGFESILDTANLMFLGINGGSHKSSPTYF